MWSVSIEKSSGNTFRSIQILPLLSGLFEKNTQGITHVLVIEKRKGSSVDCFAAKLSTAQKRTPDPSKLSVPFSYLNFEDLPNISWKETCFPTVLPILNPQEFAFEGSSFMSNVLSIWVKLIDFDDISTWILGVTMTPWLHRIIKQPPYWELFIQAYAVLNQHWITLQLLITSRKKSSCIGTCRPRE